MQISSFFLIVTKAMHSSYGKKYYVVMHKITSGWQLLYFNPLLLKFYEGMKICTYTRLQMYTDLFRKEIWIFISWTNLNLALKKHCLTE